MNEIHKNLNENEIVCSNWDFVKVGDDWTLDGISMNLNNKAAGRFGNFRWKNRLRMSVLSGTPFMKFLRADYLTDWIVLLVMFQSIIIIPNVPVG